MLSEIGEAIIPISDAHKNMGLHSCSRLRLCDQPCVTFGYNRHAAPDATSGSTPPNRAVLLSHELPLLVGLEQSTTHVAGIGPTSRLLTRGSLIETIYPGIQRLPQMSALTDTEQILAWQPDAIFTFPGPWTDSLTKIGVRPLFEFTLREAQLEKDAETGWRRMGEITHQQDRAALFEAHYRQEITHLASASCTCAPATVAVLWSGRIVLDIANRTSYLNGLLAQSAARNVASALAARSVNIEEVYLLNPDVILLGHIGNYDGVSPIDFYNESQWSALNAVRHRRVYLLPNHSFYNWLVDAPLLIAWMRETLHPDNYRPTIRATYRRTFEELYHYNLSDSESKSRCSLRKIAHRQAMATFWKTALNDRRPEVAAGRCQNR